jgi:hypothetical protein
MKLFLGFCSHGSVNTNFMMNTYRLCGSGKLPIGDLQVAINPYIAQGRCMLFQNFLNSDCDWMLSLDHDIIVTEEAIQKMMLYVDRYNVVSGMYVNAHNIEGKTIDLPLFYQKDDKGGFCPVQAVADSGAMDIDAAGFGLLLIKRDLIERMKDAYADDPWHWCGHDIHNGNRLGEDLTFFKRAATCGLKAVGVFGAEAQHLKFRAVTSQDIGRIHG